MTFAALSTTGILVLAAATAAAVVWLFFLKLRHPRILIPSLLLWHSLLREERPESWWDRIRRAVSLVLTVLIALLIVFALGRPQTGGDAAGLDRPSTVVVDTSPTMLTRTRDGRTRWDHARERAIALIENGDAAGVELLDTSGTVVVPAGADVDQKLAVLRRLTPRVAARSVLDAIARSSTDRRLWLVSDGVGVSSYVASDASRKDQVVPISVFEPADNVGITAFDIREVPSQPGMFEAYLELVNYSQQPRQVDVRVGSPIRPSPPRTIAIAPNEAYRETIDAAQLESGIVRADIRTDGDAFDLDNAAHAYLPARRPVRVLLVTPGSEYLQTSLALDPRVSLTTISPKQYAPDDNAETAANGATADVYIFDRFVPPTAPPGPVLLFGLPAVPWIDALSVDLDRAVLDNPVVTSSSSSHAVLRSVSLRDVMIKRAVGLTIKQGGRAEAVASAGDRPLVIAGDGPQKWVLVGFPLEASDFGTQLGFPIFLRNVIGWFAAEQPSIPSAPGLVTLPGRATVSTADGREIRVSEASGATVFEALPGVYFARAGREVTPVVVNLATRAISDVNHTAFGRASAPAPDRRSSRRDVWPTLVLLALALVSLEWFTYHRRITV